MDLPNNRPGVLWGPCCTLEGLQEEGAFPPGVDGGREGVRVWMVFLAVGPGRTDVWGQGRAGCVLGGPSAKGL